MGSVAYQGAQDVLWVLERKPKDDLAFLHIRDKDAEDQTIALRFLDGHWEYIGEGEEYEVSRDSRKIIQVLNQEPREFGIPEIMKAAGFKEEKYPYVRNMLVSLVKDDFIHRTKQAAIAQRYGPRMSLWTAETSQTMTTAGMDVRPCALL